MNTNATPKQRAYLLKLNPELKQEELDSLTVKDASILIYRLTHDTKEKKEIIKKEIAPTDRKSQEELIEEYKDLLSLFNERPDMVKYYLGEVSYIWNTKDNERVIFEKPRIETHFCFGYGYCGMTDEESENNADEMCHHARTNEEYFIRENLKGLEELINCVKANIAKMKDVSKWYEEYYMNKYNNASFRLVDNQIYFINNYHYEEKYQFKALEFISDYLLEERKDWESYKNLNFKKLTIEDLEELLAIYENEKQKFLKRLNTYLKRYGLSKLSVWSYLRD